MGRTENLNNKIRMAYEFIKDHIDSNGYSPTYREIGAELGVKSTADVHLIVAKLVRTGKITMVPGKTRTMKVVDEDFVREGAEG